MSKPTSVTCPDCGGPMMARVNGKTGQAFWGCKAFPKCQGTRDTDGRTSDEARGEREADRRRGPYERKPSRRYEGLG